MENLPKNIQDLLNSVESKNNTDGGVSSPEKKNGKEIPPEIKMEILVNKYIDQKIEIEGKAMQTKEKISAEIFKELEKKSNETLEELRKLAEDPKSNIKEELREKLIYDIKEAGDKCNEADAQHKNEEMHRFGAKLRALKKIRKELLEPKQEASDEDEEDE